MNIENKNSGKKGQVAIILLLVAAMGLIFYAAVLNIQKSGETKTKVILAADSAASVMASELASYGQKLFKEQMGGEEEICEGSGFGFLQIIISIILVVVTVLSVVFAPGISAALFYTTAIWLALSANTIVQVLVIQPQITSMWNKMMEVSASQADTFSEGGMQAALQGAVADSKEVADLFDINTNGKYGYKEDGTPEDKISRYSYYYTERIRLNDEGRYNPGGGTGTETPTFKMDVPYVVKKFQDELADFLYDNPDGLDENGSYDPRCDVQKNPTQLCFDHTVNQSPGFCRQDIFRACNAGETGVSNPVYDTVNPGATCHPRVRDFWALFTPVPVRQCEYEYTETFPEDPTVPLSYVDAQVMYPYPAIDANHQCHYEEGKVVPSECNPCCVPPSVLLSNVTTIKTLPDCCDCSARPPRQEYLPSNLGEPGNLCTQVDEASPIVCPKDPMSCDGSAQSIGPATLQCGVTSTCDVAAPYSTFNQYTKANYPWVYDPSLDDWTTYSDGINWTAFNWTNYDWVNNPDQRPFVFSKLLGRDDENKNYFRNPRHVDDYSHHPQQETSSCSNTDFKIEDATGYQTDKTDAFGAPLFIAKDEKPGFIFPLLYKMSKWGLALSTVYPSTKDTAGATIPLPKDSSGAVSNPLYNLYNEYWQSTDKTNVDSVMDVTNAKFHQKFYKPAGCDYPNVDANTCQSNVVAGINDANDVCGRKNNRVCDIDLCANASPSPLVPMTWDDSEDCYGRGTGFSNDPTSGNPYVDEATGKGLAWDKLFPPEMEGRWVLPIQKVEGKDINYRVRYEGGQKIKNYVRLQFAPRSQVDGMDMNTRDKSAAKNLAPVGIDIVQPVANLIAGEDISSLKANSNEAQCAQQSVFDFNTGMWRKGDDLYCSSTYPYDKHCDKNKPQPWALEQLGIALPDSCQYSRAAGIPDGTVEPNPVVDPYEPDISLTTPMTKGAPTVKDCACSDKGVDKEDFPDDPLDTVISDMHDFIVWAQSIVNSNPYTLAESFANWYRGAAYFLEAAPMASCRMMAGSTLVPPRRDCAMCDSLTDYQLYSGQALLAGQSFCFYKNNPPPGGRLYYWISTLKMLRDRLNSFLISSYETMKPHGNNLENCYTAFCVPNAQCRSNSKFYTNSVEKTILDNSSGLNQVQECLNWNANDVIPGADLTNPSAYKDAFPISDARKNSSWPLDENGQFEVKGNAVKFYACGQTCSDTYCGTDKLPRSIVPGWNPAKFSTGTIGSTPILNKMLACWDECTETACDEAADSLVSNWGAVSKVLNADPVNLSALSALGGQAGVENIKAAVLASPYYDSNWQVVAPKKTITVIDDVTGGPSISITDFPLIIWRGETTECANTVAEDGTTVEKLLGAGIDKGSPWYNAVAQSAQDAGPAATGSTPAPCDPRYDPDDPTKSGWLGFVRQSAVEAENQVVKMRRRAEFLSARENEVRYVLDKIIGQEFSTTPTTTQAHGMLWHLEKFLSCTPDDVTGEFVGPVCNLIKARRLYPYVGNQPPQPPADGGGGGDEGGDDSSNDEEDQPSNPKYTIDAIYGWRTEGKIVNNEEVKDGSWHIAQVKVWMPKKGYSKKWPYIKTWTENMGTTRCYAMKSTNGIVYAQVRRWDQTKPSGVNFANGIKMWDFKSGANPYGVNSDSSNIETTCNTDGDTNPLFVKYKGKVADYTEERLHKVFDGAFMLGLNGDAGCKALSEKLLSEQGFKEDACAAYKLHDEGYRIYLKSKCPFVKKN
ncbi:MAG: hypothetical protein HQL25_03590 [Candidatus Omnitrophica bacterium]|nr:hypothetical protein [Candidatus Omnitrophota bacterium]